ncbi:peptide deformylase [Ruixingdingia sedimenti]|uniref:Peptide deformylase n=1 Tax=Ruixingdingia sedimenti TaxID=3073604 RepID=A0ABU1F7H7_9RHOB|nr:peptide deformylase [Xinfangfangia sp. LG-4]MDR5652831.1 peptide deformylase [Xinfangfangia sp. LG-4]
MAVLQILTYPDPRLRRPCLPVGAVDAAVRQLAADMLETMYAAPGRGLAAPQVGVMLRLFVMDPDWRTGPPAPRICIDPEILDPSDATATCEEGCLSIPGVPAPVTRPAEVTLCWTGLDGIRRSERLAGIAATCAQHELDHLDGRLCIDLMDRAARAAAAPVLAALEAR